MGTIEDYGSFDIEFVYTPPKIGAGKHKDKLALMNTHHLWGPWYGTKIKNEFKDQLREWYLPIYDDNPFLQATVHFTILRNNNLRIDADSMSFVNKWFMDTLTEQNYLVDDDKCRIVLEPPIMGLKSEVETQMQVQIILSERFTMTIPEFSALISKLDSELLNYNSDKRTKAGSTRIRTMLGELKNATPQLRRDLIAADKK